MFGTIRTILLENGSFFGFINPGSGIKKDESSLDRGIISLKTVHSVDLFLEFFYASEVWPIKNF